MPPIHVIVPVYNVAPWLTRCAESILAQEGCELRVVLVDDGSTDGSGGLCDELAARDPRVLVAHTPNRGLSAARNLGMEMALAEGAELIAFVDSDDWLAPGTLAALHGALVEAGADLAWCGNDSGREGEPRRTRVPRAGVVSGDELWRAYLGGDLYVTAWGKLYRAALFDGVRFPEGRVYEDLATTHRVLARCGSAVGVPVAGYCYMVRDGSICQTPSMGSVADHWQARTERHAYLSGLLGDRPWAPDALEREMAAGVSFVWRAAWGCGREECRAHAGLLADVSRFAREELPPLGRRGWPLEDRVACLLARFDCDASLVFCHALNTVGSRARRVLGR